MDNTILKYPVILNNHIPIDEIRFYCRDILVAKITGINNDNKQLANQPSDKGSEEVPGKV